MDIKIFPGPISGSLNIIPSKSQAHRLLLCAAFANKETSIICENSSKDIDATALCLNAIGANISRNKQGFNVIPIKNIPSSAELYCGESGSTLRFMLPIVGALGIEADFIMEGRLPQRPLSPLSDELMRKGVSLSHTKENVLHSSGKLTGGNYRIDGNVSSQYITGLMFALALMKHPRTLSIIGTLQSAPYVELTKQALQTFGVTDVCLNQNFISPGQLSVEGDWSNAAFFICANTIGNSKIDINGLNYNSVQGDRQIIEISQKLKSNCTIDCSDIPDLVPIMSIVASQNCGAEFVNIQRLRLKESDRVEAIIQMIKSFGGQANATESTLFISPAQFRGCTIDTFNDHRIAMAAAIGATVASGPVTIKNANCVEKSYPKFWEEYRNLGGNYEQLIR